MAAVQNITNPSRFHNLSDAALADEIGRVDSISKAAEAELRPQGRVPRAWAQDRDGRRVHCHGVRND